MQPATRARPASRLFGVAAQALRRLGERRAQPLNRTLQTTVTLTAAVGVAGATIWAWQSTDLMLTEMVWWPLAVAFFVAAPVSLGLKSAEYQLCARIASQTPTLSRSLGVAVVSSSANLLPLPGSMIVTVRSLSEDGTSYGSALRAGAVPGLCWLAITGLIGGTAIAMEGPPLLGALTALGGLLAGIAATKLFRAGAPADRSAGLAASIIAVEAGWLLISALRLGLAVTALGVSISPTQAFALSVAGALTVAIGFFPGGLGLREALLAGLSALIGLEFETGVLLGSLDRLIWVSFLAAANGVLLLVQRSSNNDRAEV